MFRMWQAGLGGASAVTGRSLPGAIRARPGSFVPGITAVRPIARHDASYMTRLHDELAGRRRPDLEGLMTDSHVRPTHSHKREVSAGRAALIPTLVHLWPY